MTGRIVWLASYPKSGNTWLRTVYTALRQGAEPDINALEGLGPARYLFDIALGVRSSDLSQDEVDLLRPRADEAMATGPDGDVWRKIHDALFAGPSGELIVSAAATRTALYLVRDPRDVAVSWAHHAELPLSDAVDIICDSTTALANSTRRPEPQLRQRLGNWSQHVRSWADEAPFPVHVLRYEDCLADPVATFRTAFAAAGLDVSEREMIGATTASSLGRLQAQESATGFREVAGGESPFFRRGLARGWEAELPAELALRVTEEHGAVMARYGYLPSPT